MMLLAIAVFAYAALLEHFQFVSWQSRLKFRAGWADIKV